MSSSAAGGDGRGADAVAGRGHRVRAADAAGQRDLVVVVHRVERSPLFERTELRVDHLAEVHVELLGRDHQEAGRDALADLALAGQQRRGVVGVDPQPRVEPVQRRVVAGRRDGRAGLARDRRAAEAETHDHRAAALDERRARELLVQHLRHRYFPPFAITAAAFWIAVRIRGYVPQRHRWPFIAVRICASVGRFVVASRSAAWIIMPFWQ